ncbi:MAG TPA: hypothetical protein DC028_01315 [Eubacterium sp.]|nr:hypothetical protein [Eubacterium sp.]
MVYLNSSGRLFGIDYQLLFDGFITILNFVLMIIVIILPIFLICFVVYKFVKYLNVKTEYYKKHMDDRQE